MGSSDRFHVIKHANEAVDKVGKAEAGDRPVLRNTKYVWLRNRGWRSSATLRDDG